MVTAQDHNRIPAYVVIRNLSAPVYLHNMFTYAVTVTGRLNRIIHRLFIPQVSTNYGKRSLHYRGPTIWNALSMALYNANTLIQFQNMYLRTF